MKTYTQTSASMICLLAFASQLTGCFVSVSDDGYDDGYHYEDDYVYDDYSRSEVIEDEELTEEEVIENEEFFEEEVIVEEETTTTITEDNSLVNSTPVSPPRQDLLLEETFESPALDGIDRVAVNALGPWAIDWTPGSRCEHLSGTGSIEIQSDVDVGDQFEVEGLQHARLDGRCGQDLNPSRLMTSIADAEQARTLVFYARVAETAPYAELMIEWNDEVVMNEPLLDVWAEYTIDLTQTTLTSSAILTISALNPGVLIDHIHIQ